MDTNGQAIRTTALLVEGAASSKPYRLCLGSRLVSEKRLCFGVDILDMADKVFRNGCMISGPVTVIPPTVVVGLASALPNCTGYILGFGEDRP